MFLFGLSFKNSVHLQLKTLLLLFSCSAKYTAYACFIKCNLTLVNLAMWVFCYKNYSRQYNGIKKTFSKLLQL